MDLTCSVSTLLLRTIMSCVRDFRAMSRLRDHAVLPANALPRLRFIIEFAVSAW